MYVYNSEAFKLHDVTYTTLLVCNSSQASHRHPYGGGLKDHLVCHRPFPKDSSSVESLDTITMDIPPMTYTVFTGSLKIL